MAGPFNIDTTYPATTNLQSQYPAHEQAFRQTVWDWLNVFSDPADGTLRVAAFATFLAAANTWTGKQTFDDVAIGGSVDALDVTGAAVLHSTLGVTGAATLSSTLSAGASTLASAAVTGNATIGGTLGVTGAVTLTVPLAVANGGTGGATQAAARTGLGLGTMATQAASAVAITGGSVAGITDLAVADGGTGASTAAAARTALFGVSTTTDNAVARYDGVTGALQNSGVTIDDSGNISTSGDITYSSDVRLKMNLRPIPDALEKVMTLRPTFYDRIDRAYQPSAGLIAQDVKAVFPEGVIQMGDGYLAIASGPVLGLLVAAVQELARGASR